MTLLVIPLLFLAIAGCLGTSGTAGEPSLADATTEPQLTPTPLDPDDPFVRDATSFAEHEGLSLEEAVRRLEFQETIGAIQPELEADLPDSYAGLWVEHQPQYRIVIALTEGNESTIQPYVDDKAWADHVEVRPADYSLAVLRNAQQEASRVAGQLNLALTTAVDVKQNRVELLVGNPDLFQADLAAVGLDLPPAVIILPIAAEEPLPETNQGVLFEANTADGRTVYLPKQPPVAESMAALMEGELIEVDGCLRITDDNYKDGFLILWPSDSDFRVGGEQIEVLNGAGEIVARVGERLRLGGGAMESSRSMERFDELIPGLAKSNCPGPYWVAGEIETLSEQMIPDIYINPYSSGDRILAFFIYQSRSSQVEGTISGELSVDSIGCLRVGDYAIFWPPDSYLREDPLRVFDRQNNLLAEIGEVIELSGAEKQPQDYRFFENKVNCSGPYWGTGIMETPGSREE
jgi:hypothetical protein